MNVDLHSHSTISDGALGPEALVARARSRGVDVLALTDHDELDGLAAARSAAHEAGIRFVDGVEISVTWRGGSVHVVGLDVDPHNRVLRDGLAVVRGGRLARARRIAADFARIGIDGTLEGALRHAAGNPAMVGRSHFARHLVEAGVVPDARAAFRRYLVPGKPGYVPHQWASLGDAVAWIRAAGGLAVLAHPGRYSLSPDALADLLGQFRDHGGEGVEVVTGSHAPEEYRRFGELSRRYGLAASRGSDFHAPDDGADLGSLPDLDAPLRPVWSRLASLGH